MKSLLITSILIASYMPIYACTTPSISGPSDIYINTPKSQGTSVTYRISNPNANYPDSDYFVEWSFPLQVIEEADNGDYVKYYSGENAISGGNQYTYWTIKATVNYVRKSDGVVWNQISTSRSILAANWELINSSGRAIADNNTNIVNENKEVLSKSPQVLKIYNLKGQVIWDYNGEPFDFKNTSEGLYIAKYREANGKITKKQIYITN